METESEYSGVRTLLFHIYNEDKAPITHIAVAEVPLYSDSASDASDSSAPDDDSDDNCPNLSEPSRQTRAEALVVAGFGGAPGAVRAWRLPALRPPPLCAVRHGDLRARRASRRASLRAREHVAEHEPEPEPDEAAVRALCSPPEYEYWLQGALTSLNVAPDDRSVWTCEADARVTCLSLPALRPLRVLRGHDAEPEPAAAHEPAGGCLGHVYPELAVHLYVTWRGRRVWPSAATDATAPLEHEAPVRAAVLAPGAAVLAPGAAVLAPGAAVLAPGAARPSPPQLLVAAGDYLYVWQSRATPQPSPADVDVDVDEDVDVDVDVDEDIDDGRD